MNNINDKICRRLRSRVRPMLKGFKNVSLLTRVEASVKIRVALDRGTVNTLWGNIGGKYERHNE